MKPGTVLRTHADFDNAMYFGLPVNVWQDGQIIDYGGPIKKHDELSVKVNDGYFLKAVCEFRVR